jgi:hypothetical protein
MAAFATIDVQNWTTKDFVILFFTMSKAVHKKPVKFRLENIILMSKIIKVFLQANKTKEDVYKFILQNLDKDEVLLVDASLPYLYQLAMRECYHGK